MRLRASWTPFTNSDQELMGVDPLISLPHNDFSFCASAGEGANSRVQHIVLEWMEVAPAVELFAMT